MPVSYCHLDRFGSSNVRLHSGAAKLGLDNDNLKVYTTDGFHVDEDFMLSNSLVRGKILILSTDFPQVKGWYILVQH